MNCQRQIDLAADLEENNIIDGHIYHAALSAFAEVKKSEDPWVVLKTQMYENPQTIYMNDTLIDEYNASGSNFELRQQTANHALANRVSWFGHGIHEAFKKPQDLGRWFKSASSACRAAWLAKPRHTHQDNLSSIWLRHPVVILSGQLFSAESTVDFQIKVEEISRAAVFYRETNASFDKRFLVDLVTLSALPEYVKELKERHRLAHEYFTGRMIARRK